jgi:hypothetical protein
MSLENKISGLRHTKPSVSRSGKNVFKMGTIFKATSRFSDIKENSIPVDDGTKSKINKTIPVEDLPQKEEIVLEQEELVVEKVEIVEPVIKNIQLNSSGSSKSGSKL